MNTLLMGITEALAKFGFFQTRCQIKFELTHIMTKYFKKYDYKLISWYN